MTLEELTKEELVWLLRENATGFDERQLLVSVLIRRMKSASAKSREELDKQSQLEKEMRELIEPYKTGSQYRIPFDVWDKHKKMERERNAAFEEFMRLIDVISDTSDEVMAL